VETLQAVKRRLSSAEQLHSVVRTMKMLAAVNIRECDQAVEALAHYNETVERGFQILLQDGRAAPRASEPETAERLGIVVFGSDQGMCGELNEAIVSHALHDLEGWGAVPAKALVLAVGSRAAAGLEESGYSPLETLSVPESVQVITPLVRRLLLRFEAWESEDHIDRIAVYFNKRLSGASYRPESVPLLPLEPAWLDELASGPWPSRTLPTFSVDPGELLSSLIGEYLFVGLFRACAESMASENASRLASMEGAEKNIEEMLEDLGARYRQRRQTAITEELLDLVAGFDALSKD
jgi:F-type H+-transporting ATPase subunit gamma